MTRVNSAEPGEISDHGLRSTNPAELGNEIEQIRDELAATVAAFVTKLDVRNRLRKSAAVVAVVAVAAVAGWVLIRRMRR